MIDVQRADRPYASFYLSFASDSRDLAGITDYLSRNVQPQLSTIQGVQRVTVEAGRPLAMRVWTMLGEAIAAGISALIPDRGNAPVTSRPATEPPAERDLREGAT